MNKLSLVISAIYLGISSIVTHAQVPNDCLVRQDPGYLVEKIRVIGGAPEHFALEERIQIQTAENRICRPNEKCYIARGDYVDLYKRGSNFELHHKDARDRVINIVLMEPTKYTGHTNYLQGKTSSENIEYFLMYLGVDKNNQKRKHYRLEAFSKDTPASYLRPNSTDAVWNNSCPMEGGSGNGIDPPDFP